MWPKAEKHGLASVMATLLWSGGTWDGNMGAILLLSSSCLCGLTAVSSSMFVSSSAQDCWEHGQRELNAWCQQLGLTDSPALLPVSSSDSAMSWEATWRSSDL